MKKRLKRFIAHEGPVIFFAALFLFNVGCNDSKSTPASQTDSSAGIGAPSSDLVGTWTEKSVAEAIRNNSISGCGGLKVSENADTREKYINAEIMKITADGHITSAEDIKKDQPLVFEDVGQVGANGKIKLSGKLAQEFAKEKIQKYDFTLLMNAQKEITLDASFTKDGQTVNLKDIADEPPQSQVRIDESEINKFYELSQACLKSL